HLGSLEVLDWRADTRDADALVASLRDRYGEELAIWAEGVPRLANSLTRAELAGRRAAVLAVATAPPEGATLQAVLAEVQPRVLVLLPPGDMEPPDIGAFVRQVAGMLQVALREHGGRIDAPRMAARVAARPSAIVAALRLLEAQGVVALEYAPDGALRARSAARPPEASTERYRLQEAHRVLDATLRETVAYRKAYATEPAAVLLATDSPA
ncbi:MAG: hypothetical protein GX649_01595, partial [Chloroflexi bacterium]|nr:hypothetical protein [Chloroflexota bacterium]